MGAFVVAAMAAKQKQKKDEEEEQLTPYSAQEIEDGWEFKIVRSASGAFSKPEELRKLLDREAQSGWVMLEKFDSERVRFKRPISARDKDASLPAGVDPYSTQFGIAQGTYELMWGLGVGGGVVLLIGLLGWFLSTQ